MEDLTVVIPAAYLGASDEPIVPGRYLATGRLQISR